MERNDELIDKVLHYIENHPDEWDQETWFCGTTACFAGRALLMSGFEIVDTALLREKIKGHEDYGWLDDFEMIDEAGNLVREYTTRAAERLGLNWDDAIMLFNGRNDLEDLRAIIADIRAES
jgi:hypothetical protein